MVVPLRKQGQTKSSVLTTTGVAYSQNRMVHQKTLKHVHLTMYLYCGVQFPNHVHVNCINNHWHHLPFSLLLSSIDCYALK